MTDVTRSPFASRSLLAWRLTHWRCLFGHAWRYHGVNVAPDVVSHTTGGYDECARAAGRAATSGAMSSQGRYSLRATGVLARTGVGRTTRKADTGAGFHPATRPTFSVAVAALGAKCQNALRLLAVFAGDKLALVTGAVVAAFVRPLRVPPALAATPVWITRFDALHTYIVSNESNGASA